MAEDIGMSQLSSRPHSDGVHLEIEESNQPRYRKKNPRPSSSYGLGSSLSSTETRARHSYHGEDEATLNRDILKKLPSRQLANQVKHVMGSEGWRAKHTSQKRRPGYTTLRLHGDDVAGELADQLLQSQEFVDEPDALQIEDIKEQYPATTLATKKKIKENIEKKRKKKQKKPSALKTASYSLSLSWKKFKEEVAEVAYSIELWKSHFKAIEGHFGTGVTSYFRFIKWLFLLNIPVFLLSFAFVIVPQLLHRYIELDGYNNTNQFQAQDILTGSGWLNETELYYGTYSSEPIEIVDGVKYEMKYAYLLTVFAYYLVVLIVTMISLSQSYRKNYIEAGDEFNFYYVTKVFSGWDHSINDPKAAQLKHKGLFKELQEYLSGFRKDEKQKTWTTWCGLLLLRTFTNLLVLGMLVGSGYLVWYISVTQSLSNDIEVLSVMALPLCISAINFILPFAFSILASFEQYQQPKTETYITMIRTIVLNLCTLGVLVYFWFTSVDCSKRDENDDRWMDSELECRPCWETFMGEEIYRLVIVDFIFILVVTFLAEFVRRLMSQFCCKSLGYPEFNIGRNTLNLIYSQILVWIGTYYSPMLSFINIVKLFIIFYVKRISVTQNCVPSVKPWRGGRTHTVILGLLFAALLLSIFSVGYSIVFLQPSQVCGPYVGYNATYLIIRDQFDKWSANSALTILVETVTSTFFVVALFLVLCVAAHWSRVVAKGHEEMANILKHQISLEGKDKLFLLQLLGAAGKKQDLPAITVTNAQPTVNSAPKHAANNNAPTHTAAEMHYNPGFVDRSFSETEGIDMVPNMNAYPAHYAKK